VVGRERGGEGIGGREGRGGGILCTSVGFVLGRLVEVLHQICGIIRYCQVMLSCGLSHMHATTATTTSSNYRL